MRKIIPLLAVICLVSACVGRNGASTDRESLKYQKLLAETIQRADKIVVTEHSSEGDAYDMNAGKSLVREEILYNKRELTLEQKQSFLSNVKGLNPKTQDVFSACIPEYHHTIRFYTAGKLTSTMEICFECGQIEWNATRDTPPAALYGGLYTFIRSVGLSPERDWSALAKRRLKNQ